MASTQTYSGTTAEQYAALYEMRLLTRAVASFPHWHVAQLGTTPKTVIPEHRGDTVNWRRFSALSAATTPLNEGQTPEATDVSVTSVTATVEEYGAWIQYTGMLEYKAIDPMLVNYAELLGEQTGDTLDQLVREEAATTTNIVYAGGRSARDELTASDVLDAAAIYKGLRALQNENARPIEGNRYIGIMSPYTYYDFRQDSTILNMLLDVEDKGKQNPLMTGYVGAFAGIDWYVSTNAKVYSAGGASSNDVHATMIFGRDAIGIAGLGSMMPGRIQASQFQPNTGKRVRPVKILTVPAEPTKDDPLGQRGTIGWYTTFVCELLNENFMVSIEHGVTA